VTPNTILPDYSIMHALLLLHINKHKKLKSLYSFIDDEDAKMLQIRPGDSDHARWR